MKRKRYIETIALFMIALILSLPIYASSVYAGFSSTKAYGSTDPDLDNIYKPGDTLTIEAEVSISGDSQITPDQVKYFDTGNLHFSSCQQIDMEGNFKCTYDPPNIYLYSNLQQIPLYLYDDNENLDSSTILTVYEDSEAPQVSFSTGISDYNVAISYTVTDTACSDCGGVCSGIKKIEVHSSEKGLAHTENIDTYSCSSLGAITLPVSQLMTGDGTINITLKAYDNFDQTGASDRSFAFDSTAPEILASTLRIYDSGGNNITFMPSAGMTASISIEIQAYDLNYTTADLAVFGLSVSTADSCEDLGSGRNKCIWQDKQINISAPGDMPIKFEAHDFSGNKAELTVSYNLQVDTTGPSVTSIKTDHEVNGQYYIAAANNTITAEVTEDGIGLNNKDVYLDFSGLGGSASVQADNCSVFGATWICSWNNVTADPAHEGPQIIFIAPGSKDDFGNALAGLLTQAVIVDSTLPVISDVIFSPQFPTSSDTLTVEFDVYEINGFNAYVNASAISTETFPQKAECQAVNESKSRCAVEVGSLVSHYISDKVTITAEDHAGNKAAPFDKDIEIFAVVAEGTPNFFSVSSIEVIPSRIDKRTASELPMNVFVHVTLESIGSGTIIAKTVSCGMGGSLMTKPEVMNEHENDPYIALKLGPAVGFLNDSDSLPINCTLGLYVRDNQTLYMNPEQEAIQAELGLYGNSLGELTEALTKKLESIENEIKSVDEEIEGYEGWISTWGAWCQISQMLGTLNSILQGIKSIVYLIASAMYATGYGIPKAISLWSSICPVLTIFHNFIEMFIWPSGYSLIGIIGLINKYTCMIGFHCALCDWSAILQMAVSALGNYIGGKVAGVGTYEAGDKVRIGDTEYTRGETPNFWYNPEDRTVYSGGDAEVSDYVSGTAGTQVVDIDGNTRLSRTGTRVSKTFNSDDKFNTPNKVWTMNRKGDWMSGDGAIFPGGSAMVYELEKRGEINVERKWYKQRIESDWLQTAEKTTVESPGGSGAFDPYKSIHYAKACLCLPAIVYNLKKDKQIKCMYRNCVQNHIEKGLPLTTCDTAYKERECLYVESAQFKEHGYMGGMFNSLWKAAKDNWALLLNALAFTIACYEYNKIGAALPYCNFAVPLGVKPTLCGLWGAANTLYELYGIFDSKFSFDNYDQELGGEDYCASGNHQ